MQGTFMGINNLVFQVVNLNSYLAYNSYLAFQPDLEQGQESGENTKEGGCGRRRRRRAERGDVVGAHAPKFRGTSRSQLVQIFIHAARNFCRVTAVKSPGAACA